MRCSYWHAHMLCNEALVELLAPGIDSIWELAEARRELCGRVLMFIFEFSGVCRTCFHPVSVSVCLCVCL